MISYLENSVNFIRFEIDAIIPLLFSTLERKYEIDLELL